MNWNGHGWRYARNWASRLGQGFLIPVYLLGLSGPRGGRAGAALTLASVLGLIVLLPTDQRLLLPVVLAFTFVCYQGLIQSQGDGPRVGATVAGLALVLGFAGAAEIMRARGGDASLPSPDWLPSVTSYVFVCAALLAPLLAWKTPGARARVLCWAMFCSGLMFAISVHGDWMKGWRWMSLVSVPGSVVLACGVSAGASVVQGAFTTRPEWGPIGWVAALTLLISPVPVQIQHTVEFAKKPETGPFSVRARVNHKNKIKTRLHWYGPVTDLDVDQGAHLWWSGHRMLDIAGLVDVPLGQHKFDRSFITEYLFEENKPHFAHVHGGWANNSRIPSNPAWRRDYVEVPGYPAGQMIHIGNFIRRDLLMASEWDSLPDRRVPLSQDLVLEGWRIPSGVTAPDRRLYIEVAVSTSKRRRHRDDPRMLVFLVDPLGQTLVTWDLALGYDWLMPHKWTDREVFVGRYSPMIPASVPHGEYELGFLFLDSEGRVLPAMRTMHPDDPTFAAPPAGAIVPGLSQIPARLARGEVRFTRAVTIGPVEAVIDASMARLGEAHTNAQANACVEAEDAWFTARTHRPRATPFFEAEGPGVHQAIAECWARKATEEPEQTVAHLARGRDWDRTAPGLVAAIRPVADAHYASGKAALDAEDWETAYRDLSSVLRIAPHRSWARRYAEQARSERLEIVPTTQATREADAKRRRAEAEARRKQHEDRAGPDASKQGEDEAPPQAPDAP